MRTKQLGLHGCLHQRNANSSLKTRIKIILAINQLKDHNVKVGNCCIYQKIFLEAALAPNLQVIYNVRIAM